MKKNYDNIWYIIVLTISTLLVISAIIHRNQFELLNEVYIKNNIIHFEMICLILLIALNLVNFILIIIKLLQRKWKESLTYFIVFIISFASVIISLLIDYPTLIFMT